MAPRQSAQRAPVTTMPAPNPVKAALAKIAQNFQIDLAPFSEGEKALVFKEQAATALTRGITDIESHRNALMLLKEGKRLKRGIDEHWKRVTRWLEERKVDIRNIMGMDLELVDAGVTGLGNAILAYENVERQRIAAEQERQRQENERIAQANRDRELAVLEEQALAAESASEDLSDRERRFVERVAAVVGATTEALAVTLADANAAAQYAGFKQDNYGAVLMARPKIVAAIEGKRQAAAVRTQAAAVAEKPVEVAKPQVESNIAKVAGTRRVTTWTGECIDKDALIDAVLAGTADRKLLMPNQVEINNLARAIHEHIERIPGLRAIKRKTVGG